MSLKTATIGFLMAAVALSACVAPQGTPAARVGHLTFDGMQYATADAALSGIRSYGETALAGLQPEAQPIPGKALIIVPDKDRLRPFVAYQAQLASKVAVIGAPLDQLIEVEREIVHIPAETLLKSHLFESASLVEQNEANDPSMGDADYLIWFQVRPIASGVTTAWVAGWRVRRAGSQASQAAGTDPGVPSGTARYASFVKSVRQATQRIGGNVATIAGAGTQPAGDKTTRTLSSGSGIVIDTQGYILTNNHVVQVCPQPRITDGTNATFSAAVTARDAANDLAVLKVDHRWPAAAALRDSRDLRQGDNVVVTGFPLSGLVGSGMSLTTGTVTALAGIHDDSRLVQVAAPVQPGNSGGPLLDASGNVVGVVTSTLNGMLLAVAIGAIPQNVNFAIKTAVARNFLDTNHVSYATAPPRRDIGTPDIGDNARKFTVRIECRE